VVEVFSAKLLVAVTSGSDMEITVTLVNFHHPKYSTCITFLHLPAKHTHQLSLVKTAIRTSRLSPGGGGCVGREGGKLGLHESPSFVDFCGGEDLLDGITVNSLGMTNSSSFLWPRRSSDRSICLKKQNTISLCSKGGN